MLMAQEPASPGLALPVLELVYLKKCAKVAPANAFMLFSSATACVPGPVCDHNEV
jgi:hypothetical protein